MSDRRVEVAERAVIGALLMKPDTFHDIRLSSDDFSHPQWRKVYSAICEAIYESEPIESITIAASAGVEPKLVFECVKFCSDPDRITGYAEVVSGAALDRRIRRLAQTAMGSEFHGPDLLSWLQTEVTKLSLLDVGADAVHIGEAAATVTDIARRRSRGEIVRCGEVVTGVPPFDEYLALNRGNCATIAGRPGMGKSAFALWVILLLLIKGERVLLFSTEATKEEIAHRLLALLTNLNSWGIARGRMSWENVDRLAEARDWLEQQPLWVDDQSKSKKSVIRQIRRYKLREKITTVVVDHLQEMNDEDDKRHRDERSAINSILAGLRDVAKEEPKVCMWLVSQLNRGVDARDDKRPLMSDLKESGTIEQASHMVFLLYRAAYYYKSSQEERPWKLDLMVAKNRNGPTGKLIMHWEKTGQVGGAYDELMHLWKVEVEAGGVVRTDGLSAIADAEEEAGQQSLI